MPKLTIQNFGGEVPRTSPRFLQDNDAVEATNVKLYSGTLRTWKGPVDQLQAPVANADTIYRFENPTTAAVKWLSWATQVHVQRSSLIDNTDFRLYFTGSGAPKKTNWTLADNTGGGSPVNTYAMGVKAPTAAPTVAAIAGGLNPTSEVRYYVYTYVSTFGTLTEESAPSPVSAAVTCGVSQQITVSNLGTTPPTGYANITHKRIYRTLPGEASDGEFVFVAQVTIATASTNDNVQAAALGDPLETVGWSEPPATMQGLTSMANGMMAGFVGNTVYFCEPYFHHAWPVEYAQSVPDQIVALASYGATLVVLTEGQPWAMTGVAPDQITVEKIPMPEPCISSRSVAVDEYGVIYASPNGLVSIGQTTRGIITNKLFRRDEWQLYSPGTIVGAIYDGKYFAAYQSSTKGLKTMVISRDDFPALSFLTQSVKSFYYDVQDGALYYLDRNDNEIYQMDADQLQPYTYQWESKRFVFDRAYTWSVVRVDVDVISIETNADYAALVAALEAENQAIVGDTFGALNAHEINEYAINASSLIEIPSAASTLSGAIIFIGENDEIMATLDMDTFDVKRIPAFRSRELRIRLVGKVNIRAVDIATSFLELRNGN